VKTTENKRKMNIILKNSIKKGFLKLEKILKSVIM